MKEEIVVLKNDSDELENKRNEIAKMVIESQANSAEI